MTKKQQDFIVNQILSRLFINGEHERAKRLVLELEDGRDGGGWCKEAVRDQILEVLKESETA